MTSPILVYSLGDSISVQYGEYLPAELGATYQVLRRSGDRQARENLNIPKGSNSGDSTRLLEYIAARVALQDFNPDLVIFNCGLHDIKRQALEGPTHVSLEDYRANLRKIAVLLKENGLRVAWISTTPSNDVIHNEKHYPGFFRLSADVADFNRAAAEEMTKAGIPIIELGEYTRTLGTDEELFADHVHFQPEIRRRQAEYLARWIKAYLFGEPARSAIIPEKNRSFP